MEPRTVKLRTPIEFGSQRIEELTFRPVTGKDVRRFQVAAGFEIDACLTLAGRLTGQPDAVIDKLSGDDLEEVIEIAALFMPGGRRTGRTPSES
jgi:hypothetical protein